MREKHCSWLKIYDRLRASEQLTCNSSISFSNNERWLLTDDMQKNRFIYPSFYHHLPEWNISHVDCRRKLTSCISDAQLFGNSRKLGDIADHEMNEGRYGSISMLIPQTGTFYSIKLSDLLPQLGFNLFAGVSWVSEKQLWSVDEQSAMRKRMVVLWNLGVGGASGWWLSTGEIY